MPRAPRKYLRTPRRGVPLRHRATVILGLVAVAAGLGLWLRHAERAGRSALPVAPAIPYDHLAAHQAPSGDELGVVHPPRPFTLRRGQTAAHLLRDLGVEGREVHSAVTALGEHVDLRRLKAGERGLAYFAADGRFESLRLRLERKGWVSLEAPWNRTATAEDGEGWRAEWSEFVRTERVRRIEGKLESFLVSDIERAGGPSRLAWAMADVLQWDLDFNRDLRRGDTFRVVWEEELLDGRFDRVNRVLALEYVNRGDRYEAYLYGEQGLEGYYDGDGRPLQKMFLKSPLPFTRVTSRFSHRRLHPVLGTYRPHYGVDFGAPRGTPVRATATGTVTLAGRNGGAGNMVRVRHANGYETSYLHLSGFASGIRRGARVRQGDLVGYVGSTGLSTGPHLDYRVKKSGRYLDPLRLDNRPADPIPQHRLAEFLDHRDRVRSVLDGGDPAGLEETVRVARARATATGASETAGEQTGR